MSSLLDVAAVQVCQGADLEANIAKISSLVREAAGCGAQFVVTPECSDSMIWPATDKLKLAFSEEDHPVLAVLRTLADELDIWILIGSLAIKHEADNKLYNRSYLVSNRGEVKAHYDKIHLFDADLGGGESYRESANYRAGDCLKQTDLPWARLGMSICYDLRFPHLYRALAQKGAEILAVPAAFSVPTGHAHWEVLLRARAIENGSFVIAAGQTGVHPGGRSTYGHSMIIGPWGEIIAQMGAEEGVISAQIDLQDVVKCRKNLPSLRHDRDFSI